MDTHLEVQADLIFRSAPWSLLSSTIDLVYSLEPTTLALLPSALLVIATPFFLRTYGNSTEVTAAGKLLASKLAVCALLVGLETSAVRHCAELSTHLISKTVVSSIASCLSSLCLAAVLLSEHTSTIRSSASLAVCLLLSILCDFLRARFYLRQVELENVGVLTMFSVVMKSALAVLEEFPKGHLLKDEVFRLQVTHSYTCGFWSRTFANWIDSISFGFQYNTQATPKDNFDPNLPSDKLSKRFKELLVSDRESAHGLLKALYRTMPYTILEIIIPRICLSFFVIMQVPFIWYLLAFKEQPELLWNKKGSLMGAAMLICLGITLSRAALCRLYNRLQATIQGLLVKEIFDKILSSSSPRISKEPAEKLVVDIAGSIVQAIPELYDALGGVFEIALCAYFLTCFLGSGGAIVVVSPIIAWTCISWYIAQFYAAANADWAANMANRVSRTSTTLRQIRAIKMSNLEDVLSGTICNLHSRCIAKFTYFRRWATLLIALHTFFTLVHLPLILAVSLCWVSKTGQLLPKDVFTLFATAAVLCKSPANIIPIFKLRSIAALKLQWVQEIVLQEDSTQLLNTFNGIVPVSDGIGKAPHQVQSAGKSDTLSETNRNPGVKLTHTKDLRPEVDLLEKPTPQDNDLLLPSSKDLTIEFQKASIAAPGTRTVILNNVNIAIKHGELVMIVGPTGCGKSTLLAAMLGDASTPAGKFRRTPGKIAYCDQKSWLYHVSVLENIVGKGSFNVAWYRDVLDACLLLDDMKQLIYSDQSVVGENGSNLSSGQAQRVALARALYLQAPILILDDIFAALDYRTANQIFAKLFGQRGLLRRFQTTVIMATRPSSLLLTANRVIFINSHGVIFTREDRDSIDFRHQLRSIGVNVDEKPHLQSDDELVEHKRPFVTKTEKPTLCHTTKWQSFRIYTKHTQSIRILLLCFLLVGSSICEGIPNIVIRFWLDADYTGFSLVYIFLGLIIANVLLTVCGNMHWTFNIDAPVAALIHESYLNTVLHAKLYFLTAVDTREIIKHFDEGMRMVVEQLSRQIILTMNYGFLDLVGIYVVSTATLYTLPFLILLPIGLFTAQRHFSRMSRHAEALQRDAVGALTDHFVKTATGLRHIQNLGWRTRAQQEGQTFLHACQQPFYKAAAAHGWMTLFLETNALFTVLALVIITIFDMSSTASSVGSALAAVLTWNNNDLSPVLSSYKAQKALDEFAQLYEFKRSIPLEVLEDKDRKAPEATWPQRGRILMNQVTAAYSSSGPCVLSKVSFSIAPGEKAGIIGPTGSGKSSLILTLLNLLDYSGTIKIDGVDISTIPLKILRSKLTIISHDQIELKGSVRHNLYPWQSNTLIPDDTLSNILKCVGIWHIVEPRGGLDAIVSTLGLSHGQEQLLSIARGMLHKLVNKTKIIIMDETTSSLDLGTETNVQMAMGQVFSKCTIFVVAHRKEILQDADTILHLSSGALIGRTYPKKERAAAIAAKKAKIAAEEKARRREEMRHVRDGVEVEGGHEFDGDDEDSDDDNGNINADAGMGDSSMPGADASNHPPLLNVTAPVEDEAWLGIDPGNVPPMAPALQEMVAYMETPRNAVSEGSLEDSVKAIVEQFEQGGTREKDHAI